MAKSAKQSDVEITERTANQFVKSILEKFENIETARGRFMNLARRERDGMTAIYEGLAAKGIPQKVAKTEIKIIRAMERIKTWLTELAVEDRKLVQRIAKVRGDKNQLSLFAELPKPTKAELKEASQRAEAPPPSSGLAQAEAAGSA